MENLSENLFTIEEHSLQSFVETVFNDEPKDPSTYSLTLDTEFTNTPADLKIIFEALATVFTLAMKHKYSNQSTGQVDLTTVTQKQFEQIQAYYRSFGFEVFYEATPFTQFNTNIDSSSSTIDELPSLDDISTVASPVTTEEQTSRNLDNLPSSTEDKLEDYFITLKTEHLKYKIWFNFLA